MIIKVQREKAINGAIPSRVYLDSAFFGYGLENEHFAIPAGKYDVSGKRSEKFGSNKLYLSVPNRSGIMFHGANRIDDLRGCIGIASTRSSADTIKNDLSSELYERVNNAANAGEGVAAVVVDPVPWLKIAGLVAVGGCIVYYITKRKKRKTRK